MRYMGDDCTELGQPMHGLDIGPDLVPRSHLARMYAVNSPAERCSRRWSMLTQSGVFGQLVPVDRRVRPLMSDHVCAVVGRFAGEVAGIELRDGGVDVFEVEHDQRRDPLVGVDLDDAEDLGMERSAAGRGPRRGTTEDQVAAPDRNDV